jgi:hypothetical protein
MKVASYGVVLAGLWLIGSPWMLHYGNRAAGVDDVVVGVALWSAGMFAAANEGSYLHWPIIALGSWLVLAPWLLGFRNVSTAVVNDAAAGAVVLICAIIRRVSIKAASRLNRQA